MGRAYQNRKESMAKTSDMKAKVYSRYGREIYVCAKAGGLDPSANLALRGLIDRASYEGYGPGGCMAIIECLTDNPNRTFGDVRVAFTKTKCKIGTQGTVAHMFDHAAIFVFRHDDEEAVLEALMDADVDVTDIESEDGMLTVFTPNTEYAKARQALAGAFEGIDFEVDEIQFIPQSFTTVSGDDRELFDKFLAMLNDLDDVQNVYHNVDLAE